MLVLATGLRTWWVPSIIVFLLFLFPNALYAQEQPPKEFREQSPEKLKEDKPKEDIELPPILKEGTPGDLLLQDAIVTPDRGATSKNSGTGSLLNSLQNQLPFSFSDSGRPGNRAQVRGFGANPEDIDVQAFGISLNPPQGGGFDLSIFPQFLWSGFQFQGGPSLNAFNQTASSGTLILTPWTSSALEKETLRFKSSAFLSSAGVGQFAGFARSGQDAAVVGGYSTFKVVGPSVGLSSKWKVGSYSGRFNLLATDLDAESLGPSSSPTPQARSRVQRWIPILQSDFQFSATRVLKTSLFTDWLNLNYQDPESASFSRDQVNQWGIETAYRTEEWKLGLSGRQVRYTTASSFSGLSQTREIPTQTIANLQVSRDFFVGARDDIWIEPTLQGVWVNGFGFLPQGTLGAKKEWDERRRVVFVRLSFSRRIPSLLDRYYSFATFVGNADLKTESDWTGMAGGEIKFGILTTSLQAYGQFRQNAQIYAHNTVTNLDHASLFSVTGKANLDLFSQLEAMASLTGSKSQLLNTGVGFPYISPWQGLVGFRYHDRFRIQGHSRLWEVLASFRFASERVYHPSTAATLPSYAVIDLGFSIDLLPQISLAGRVENVFNQSIELIQGFPLGRTFSLMVSGQI